VFVTGTSNTLGRGQNYTTVAYDAISGGMRWVAQYGSAGTGSDMAAAIAISPDGTKVLVTGRSPWGATQDDYVTVAYSADSGNKLWLARYNGPGNVDDAPVSVGVTPDG